MFRKNSIISILILILFITFDVAAQIPNWIHINGYLSFEFEKTLQKDAIKGDTKGSFDADALDLVFNFQPTNRLRIATDLTWEHGSATELFQGNVGIEYAFGEYTISDWLKVRAGKMFTSYGIYNEIHTAKPTFLSVKEPNSTNRTDRVGSLLRFYPRWVTGIALLGNYEFAGIPFDYNLQVSNGDYTNPNPDINDNPFEKDNNFQKAVTGRLRINPISALQIGFSCYSDGVEEFTAKELDGVVTYSDKGTRTKFFSYGFSATYTKDDLGLEFEYMKGNVGKTSSPDYSLVGYSGMASYTLFSFLTPYFRYEGFDPNNTIADDKARVLVYGINVQVDDGLYIKVDMNSFKGETKNSKLKGKSYDEFKFSTSIGF